MSNKNSLMWSHYTDNHKGICVEYSESIVQKLSDHEKFLLQGEVNYSDSPPDIDILEDHKSQIDKMTLNKQSEWEYEKEYRVILLSDIETDFIKISPDDIKAIYIGSRPIVGITGSFASVVRLILAIYFFSANQENRMLTFFQHPVEISILKTEQTSQLNITVDGDEIESDISAVQIAV